MRDTNIVEHPLVEEYLNSSLSAGPRSPECQRELDDSSEGRDCSSQDSQIAASIGGAGETDMVPLRGSAQDVPARVSTVLPFNTPDYRFECICGELGLIDYKARVQCLNCLLWQHAECVNYKEESLGKTPFYCPHCLVAMKPVSTRATLIISPSSICHQWVDEINRHIRCSSLRVLVRAP